MVRLLKMWRSMQFIALLSILMLSSCLATYMLEDGNEVPKKKFKKISGFDPEIYSLIDTNYFYRLIGTCTSNRAMTEFRDHKENPEWMKLLLLQFYSGGYVRILNEVDMPDPARSGRRGVLYKKHGKFWMEHQGGTQAGQVILWTFKIKVEGDRIYLMLKPSVTENIFFFSIGFCL